MKNAWKGQLASGLAVFAIAGIASMAAFAKGPNSPEGTGDLNGTWTAGDPDGEVEAGDPKRSMEETPGGETAMEDTYGEGGTAARPKEAAMAKRQLGQGTEVQETGSQGLNQENEGQEADALDATGQEPGAENSLPHIAQVSEEDIDAYYGGAVLIGDSVMLGFRNYSMNRAGTYLGKIRFLASGSFSVHNAFWPVTSKSVHPIYQGKQRPVWESVGLMQPERVFLFFGLNDMNMGSLEETCSLYAQVIANIKATCPDVETHIMSMTYTLRGKGKGRLNNENIRQFNAMLSQMARDNHWGFVDLANPLADANGDLAPEYCSDNYVHQTTAAYDVWSNVLRAYARSQLDGSADFPAQGPVFFDSKDGNSGTISVPSVDPPGGTGHTGQES